MGYNNAKIYKSTLEAALNNVTKNKVELKSQISLNSWLELKKALNPINNYITEKLTRKFIKSLPNLLKKTKDPSLGDVRKNIKKLLKANELINTNANGYDFFYSPIIAEVKANIPYDNTRYGSSQKSGLTKDIAGLLVPGSKDKKNEIKLKNNYKFLVVLDYNRDKCNTLEAVKDLKNKSNYSKKIEIIEDIKKTQQLNKKMLYIVMLGL